MRHVVRESVIVALLWLGGCQLASDDAPQVSVTREALSPCDETVPANRNIDGIPAYAQCDATQNSAIFSNNGVDTSTTRTASDWIETQYSGGYQCTELAHRYLYFKWHVQWIPDGNAGEWCNSTPPSSSGVVQTMKAVHGDLMVLAPGSCGADSTYGHVNVIDVVDATGTKLTAVEQNVAGRHTYMASCAKCFLHVVANEGPASGTAGASGVDAAGTSAAGSSALPPSAAGNRASPPSVAGSHAPPLAGRQPPPSAAGGSGGLRSTAGASTPPSAGAIAPAINAGASAPASTTAGAASTSRDRDAASTAANGCGVSHRRRAHPTLVASLLALASLLLVRPRRRRRGG